ncbi:MAG: amidohydrolase family protein [Bacillota bacterium]|jgi:predicted TIM-barrel fold metal-dependent hydrolase
MKLIDAHCHIFPDKIAQKASQAIGDFYDIPMYSPAASLALLESGAKIGTDLFMVSSAATIPEQVHSINDFISSQCRRHRQFFGLAAMHYQIPDIEEELDRAVALGLHGVKFHNDFQRYDIDEAGAMDMYRAIAKRGLPVLFHMGDDHRKHTTAAQLKHVMEEVPDLKVIAAHFGGYRAWDETFILPKSENLRFDTSSTLWTIDYDLAHRIIDHFGVDKFFFGTDFPMWNPEEEMERFKKLALSAEEEDMIFHRNFEEFFGLF